MESLLTVQFHTSYGASSFPSLILKQPKPLRIPLLPEWFVDGQRGGLLNSSGQRLVTSINSITTIDQELKDKPPLQVIFSKDAIYPDSYLHSCLNRLLQSRFYLENDHEPTIGSYEGNLILGGIPTMLASSPLLMWRIGESIYIAFMNTAERRCLLCGSVKRSIPTALSCVRSHLNHKPFLCPGKSSGCKLCGEGRRCETRPPLK
jgi:hypothetical protein